ncbi:MAG: SprT-like domain-containing protein [Gammaproteobacteria bacterium]|nr:SprT-like domain-containing protein [Gammaproteobacteria bacterium]
MTPTRLTPLTDELAAEARRWLASWGVPEIEDAVHIRYSARLSRSWARCQPALGRITIQRGLDTAPAEFLREVLAHELAHFAAHALYGPAIAPHGREWRALMRAVALPARTLLAPPPGWHAPARPRPVARYYLHRCPVCRAERVAKRVVRRWRCGRCLDRGRDGELEVFRLERKPRRFWPFARRGEQM